MTPNPSITSHTTLADIAAPDGAFAVVAMDQRSTLKRMYAAVGVDQPPHDELIDIKVDVLSALGMAASAFLLDPTYGLPALDRLGAPTERDFGVLVAAEPAVRPTHEGEPRVAPYEQKRARGILDQGGSALKYLVQMRADRPTTSRGPDLAGEALDVIRAVIQDCRESGIPSVIENLIYPLPGEDITPERRADAIIDAAVALDGLRPDLLKLEYPGSPQACRRLADAIRSPWAVLSAGVDFETFTDVLKVSCDEGGASGFIAGRAVWKDAVGIGRRERRAHLASEGVRRLEGCLEAIAGRARPWTEVSGS